MMVTRALIVTFAALTGCGRIGFDPGVVGTVDGNDGDGTSPDAQVALCADIDDHFDSTLGAWTPYTAGGGSAPTVTNGSLVLDVPTAMATSSVAQFAADLHDKVVTVTVRDYTFVYGSQMFLEVGMLGRYFTLLALADPSQGTLVARIQTGVTFDDVTIPTATTAAMRLRMMISPISGGSEFVWSYSPSETAPFMEVRRMTVADTFASVDFGMTYQNWQTAVSDPPAVRVDDFQLAHPCM